MAFWPTNVLDRVGGGEWEWGVVHYFFGGTLPQEGFVLQDFVSACIAEVRRTIKFAFLFVCRLCVGMRSSLI